MGVTCMAWVAGQMLFHFADEHARCSHESIIAQARHPCMADRIEEKGVLWRGGEGGRGETGAHEGR